MTPSTLNLDRVSLTYRGGEDALKGISLDVEPGEILAIVGESGSGKTTLLKLCNRLLSPTGGRVLVDGVDVATRDPVTLRREVGYVAQEGGLIPHWRVLRNVTLVPRLRGWPVRRRIERARALLETMGLPPDRFADRYPATLSGGQAQRVALARALAAEPGLVLLDEPFAALDALTRRELQEELLRLARTFSATFLFVTHDLDEALLLGRRVAVLRRGSLVRLGTPEELLADPGHPYVTALLGPILGSRGKVP